MSSLDWIEYINFCNAALIVRNKQLKVALIQFVQSGVKNVFSLKRVRENHNDIFVHRFNTKQ